MNYIIYNASGKILRTGSCPASMFELQKREDQFIIEGKADGRIKKIVDGKVVDKTPQEIANDNPPPKEMEYGDRRKFVTNKMWDDLIERINVIENK